ncbi:MAG: TRAP transporter small permease subunit [Sphaerochaetaceae bacterium]|jgi:TRAP-type C4-dicarboxylate transport system permease small subunit|nr:TRAP transporter small permease subunit [Sphaerochaetaceae bacterium]
MKAIFKRIETAEVTISAVFIVTSCLLIFASALTRSFGKPINWFQDISLLLFAWSVFLGADAALRNDKLVRVELLTSKLSPKASAAFQLACHLVIALFLAAMIYYGAILSKKTSSRVFPGLSTLSYTWVTASFPIGSALMLATTVVKIVADIKALASRGEERCC